jgi:hypothetical protein
VAQRKATAKAGRLKPRSKAAHLITDAAIEDARQWTAKLSKPGKAPTTNGARVTVLPKKARLFWL